MATHEPGSGGLPRRQFLTLVGAVGAAGGLGCSHLDGPRNRGALGAVGVPPPPPFAPVPGLLPEPDERLTDAELKARYGDVALADALVLPPGYTYETLVGWGEPLAGEPCGYNHDYVAFVPTGPDAGLITLNFEYLSTAPWLDCVAEVCRTDVDVAAIREWLAAAGEAGLDVAGMDAADPRRDALLRFAELGLGQMGIGVVPVGRDPATGAWRRTAGAAERRIDGLTPGLACTGPAAAVFARGADVAGYDDGRGTEIRGTFANCGGGQTPWGTVLSAEENFQYQVAEDVFPDGSPFPPSACPMELSYEVRGLGSALGYAGHKYGWIVELDPADPTDAGTKHTWLGRFRHEAAGVRVVAGKPLAFYSGCDRRGGHIYKFVSRDAVADPKDRANSKLLGDGMLYGAVFEPGGRGRWVPLSLDTPVDPVDPTTVLGGLVELPRRPRGGRIAVVDAATAAEYARRFPTLGDLYTGTPEQRQGAILIDAHLAANAAGVTPTARPEDTVVAADGTVMIAFTEGTNDDHGGPDRRVFQGPGGVVPYPYGWVMRLDEDGGDPAATGFRWEVLALGGEPRRGGAGFANPDNLMLDPDRNLWIVTDMPADHMNFPVVTDDAGEAYASPVGLFGNNSLFVLPTLGAHAGRMLRFAMGPPECELTGPCMSPDGRTLFLSVQHPGETNGRRVDFAADERQFQLTAPDGRRFYQWRRVPVGSNWPAGTRNAPPRSALVAIRRQDGRPLMAGG